MILQNNRAALIKRSSLGLLAIIAFGLCACSSTPKLKRPFVWTATNGAARYTLLGTIHTHVVLEELPDSVIDEIDRSSLLYVEFDPVASQKLVTETYQEYFKRIRNPAPDAFEQLTPTAQQYVHDFLAHPDTREFLNEIQFRFPPEYASPALIEYVWHVFVIDRENFQVIPDKLKRRWAGISRQLWPGLHHSSVLDDQITEYARQKNLEIAGLDTKEFIVDSLQADEESGLKRVEALFHPTQEMVTHLSAESLNLKLVIALYRAGEGEALQEELSTLPDQDKKELFTNRNKAWAQRIVERALVGRGFIAVGVGHLLGPNNLLDHLEREGFRINKFHRDHSNLP